MEIQLGYCKSNKWRGIKVTDERKALCWQALWKYAMKSNDDELIKLLEEIEWIVEKEKLNYNIQSLYPEVMKD